MSAMRNIWSEDRRPGAQGPVTCNVCGCRLEQKTNDSFGHFSPAEQRDARGCLVSCVEMSHDRAGEPLAAERGGLSRL